jgi:DivIVA domain-containing protein
MTIDEHGDSGGVRRLTPTDLQTASFPRSTMLHPGYSEAEVDRFLDRVGTELARLQDENAGLREQLGALEERLRGSQSHEGPSTQAVGILAAAQQTADQYVAEAEAFSRVMTSEAREQYEDQLRQAREQAGAIIQAAQEAARNSVANGAPAAAEDRGPGTEELQQQVMYLQALGQATRTQLRSYLEALLSDVESEWGRAHPGGLPQPPARSAARDSGRAAAPAPAAPPAADSGAPAAEPGQGGDGGSTSNQVLHLPQ